MGPRWNSKFELKPGSGKWVFVPSVETVEVGQKIKASLEKRWRPPSHFYHLKDGGHVAALQSHLGQTCLVHLDIQNFFDSINRTRVTRCLKSRYPYDEAREIANNSTVVSPNTDERKFILPYGFVQSPLLSSLCLDESALGQSLRRVKRLDGVKVSVYVDDIIISSCDEQLIASLVEEVKLAAERSNFKLNPNKEEGPATRISAFNIELSQHSLVIKPERWAEFVEAMRTSESEHQRKGIHGYIDSVNPSQAEQLLAELK